ncbi:MAG: 23S rRNA (guanosine(2251)-2'-O)-methyltransferase RlmB [Caldilineaceae bacterium]|nr:23S rRNA (guanosine(2251)-2'-O)-methyltransferase RlmB [Caldilineaceae bacterium]MCB9139287.1 23S rRNA (guanosine(2251)-2'-O)-methyltransferase RlmB [Caldilineaceae bacterium]
MSELIYGRHAVLETLRAGRRRIYRLWLEEGRSSGEIMDEIATAAEEAKVTLRSVKGGIFDKLAQRNDNAQGVALEVDDYPYAADFQDALDLAHERDEPPLLLLLDHLQDPQNLGTLMRTAEAMGVHGIAIPDRRAASITPAVSNASAGAVEHLLVAQVTNLNRLIDALKESGVWVAGLDGDPSVPELGRTDLAGPLAVVVGNEGKGLGRLTREKCDLLVRLPMYGSIESLNAAVAGSIVLYAARQARMS